MITDEQREKDEQDFLLIWFTCSSFDERGDLQVGKWSKLEHADLPFSKARLKYLLLKYVANMNDSKNPRVED